MFRILNQPYPFPEKSVQKHIFHSFLEGLGIALFFIVFQPFGLSEWHHPNKTLVLLGYGGVVFLCTLSNRLLLPYLFPKFFQEKSWVIWKELADILLLLLFITSLNLLYSKLVFPSMFTSWHSFIWMFIAVVIIGSIPIGFGVMSNYIYQLKKYNQTIIVHHTENTDNKPITQEKKVIKLVAENEKDSVELDPQQLFFIESSDNYSTVYFEKNGKLQKEMLRSSLSRLENQLEGQNIVRCHRSFIVNLDKVEKVTGNAQGYKLHLETPELVVPVARKYSEIIEKLKEN